MFDNLGENEWIWWEVPTDKNVKNQTELKNTIAKKKKKNQKTLEGINRRLDNMEKQISNLENRVVEVTQVEQNKVL